MKAVTCRFWLGALLCLGGTGVYNGRRVQADAAYFEGTDKKPRGAREAC